MNTSASDSGPSSHSHSLSYSFNNSWPDAKKRLFLLEKFADPVTLKLLDRAVKANSPKRCLEVGAGGGSVTRWLCENTGDNAEIIAMDINTDLLRDLNYPNLKILQQDVSRQLPPGLFDLIHTRALLVHIKSREQLLEQLVKKLNPHGVILIEEPDFASFEALESVDEELKTVFSRVSKAIENYQETQGGMVHDFGRSLEAGLRRNGVDILQSETTLREVAGGSEEAQFFALTYTQIKQKVTASERIDENLFERFLKLFENSRFVFKTYSMMSVLGQNPRVAR